MVGPPQTLVQSSVRKTLGVIVGLAAVVSAATGLLPVLLPFTAVPENWLADVRQASLAPVAGDTDEIVVVTVTEDTLASLPYRSPLDRGLLVGVLGAVANAGARAVGIDILFDQATEPDKDRVLGETLRSYPLPLVVASAGGESGLTETQAGFLAQYLDGVKTGHAGLATDRIDGTVRWFVPGERTGLVAALAESLGVTVPVTPRRIDYLRPAAEQAYAFRAYPAHMVAFLPQDWFRDKVVLIGADLPMTDRHRTPFATVEGSRDGAQPGVMIHAQMLAQILDGRTLDVPGPIAAALLLFAAALLGAGSGCLDLGLAWRAIGMTGLLAVFWSASFVLYAGGGPLLPLLMPSLAFVLAAGAATAYLGRRDRRTARFIRDAFGRYVSPDIVDQLVARPETFDLGGERREVSYLFTDLAGFTSLTERVEPAVMVGILNQYLDGMCRIVLESGGTIDKIVGDAVVAFFGAPLDQPDHAQRAVECALAMDAFSEEFIANGAARQHGVGITRIGVNTGRALIGNFGGSAFFDYTGHGDMVNTAARLESLNKHLGTRVCVSDAIAGRCRGLRFRPVGAVVVKGKSEGLPVSEPLPEGSVSDRHFEAYMRAYELLDEDPLTARRAFAEIVETTPEDGLAGFHLRRLAAGECGKTIVMTEK